MFENRGALESIDPAADSKPGGNRKDPGCNGRCPGKVIRPALKPSERMVAAEEKMIT